MPQAKRTVDDLLFIGTNGHVRAVAKRSGRKVWQRSLPSTGYSIVSLLFEDGLLFAASKGVLFALNPEDGEIVWKNGLQGLGYDHVVLATMRSSSASLPALQALSDAARRQGSTGAGT